MNRVIAFEIFILALVVAGVLSGSLSLERAGQVFLTVGIIDLVMSIAAWRGWPILRGDISNQPPLSKRDSGEAARDEYSTDHDRPSTGFIGKVAALGIFAFGMGMVLLLFFA